MALNIIPGLVAGTIITGVKGLTDTTGQKLDIIIEGIKILKEYSEEDLQLSEEEKKEWETKAISWLRSFVDTKTGYDIVINGFDSSIKPSPKDRISITTPSPLVEELLLGKPKDTPIRKTGPESPKDLESHGEINEELITRLSNELDNLSQEISKIQLLLDDHYKGIKSPLLSGYDEDKANLNRQFEIGPDGKRKPKSEGGDAKGYIGDVKPEDQSMLKEIGGFIETKITDAFDKNVAVKDLGTKIDNLLARISLIGEAKADELTDAEKGKGGSGEGRAADTAALLNEVKEQQESLAAQNTETQTALNEAKNQVIFAREAVTSLRKDIGTLTVVVNDLRLLQKAEPKKPSEFDYRLDSQYKRI
jgi:hypothetical protein